jgi:hypothetical protein
MSDAKFVSVMEDHPEYVHAIGMISIELADLEASLADLLAAILNIQTDLAQAIYFTPKTVMGRLDFLSNVHAVLHPDDGLDADEIKVIRRKLKSLSDRAKKVMGKRNELLHATWGVIPGEDGGVYFGSLPLKEGDQKVARLKEVQRVVTDIRSLNDDVYELVDLIGVYQSNQNAAAA